MGWASHTQIIGPADLADELAPSPRRARARTTETPWTLSVLTVDDDDADASLITEALRRNERVRHTCSASEPDRALDDLVHGQLRPDLILLDIQMPRVDGFTFLRALREVPWMARTPVVFLTTSGYERDVKRAGQTDAAGYIVKPDTFREMRERIDDVIDRFVLES
ncbi:MAG: response regulator [Phenylobacterium sp.]|uniref:response regulator n=1 Tax=Phenylobacterium sp. TaxID=1871053 RepID=UPI0025ED5DF4|nr:response regulator [Phenylobacterium sp.]MBI1200421.1 response regulator [Phenylobacterium sp.]